MFRKREEIKELSDTYIIVIIRLEYILRYNINGIIRELNVEININTKNM